MNFTLNTKLPNMVYYNDDHSRSPGCTREISTALGCTYSLAGTWQELTKEIENGEDKIVFHIDMITKSGETIKDFVDSINTMVKFIPGHKPLRIMVLITTHTPQHKIKELKDSGILGIGLDMNYYSMYQVIDSSRAMIAGTPYWPQEIIDQLPIEQEKPVHVLFRKDLSELDRLGVVQAIQDHINLTVKCCGDWEELGDALRKNPSQIAVHVNMLGSNDVTVSEFMSMLETLMKLSTNKLVPVAIVIEDTTPLSFIKELQKTNVLGIIPATPRFGFIEEMKGLEALTNRIPYWPKHILSQLPGAKPAVAKNSIQLTHRQTQVFDLIRERGASNKAIARILGISESTVKLHITEIFKKYGVRNRTQLAVFSHS